MYVMHTTLGRSGDVIPQENFFDLDRTNSWTLDSKSHGSFPGGCGYRTLFAIQELLTSLTAYQNRYMLRASYLTQEVNEFIDVMSQK